MNPRILGIIGGLALVVALLSPFMMGSSKKVEELYNSAEEMYAQEDYEGAIAKYTEALEESTKRGVKTAVIDKDFTTLANFKIAVAYSRFAEKTGDANHFDTAIEHIEKVVSNATISKHQEGLTYLWGHVLYRKEQFGLAEAKFKQLIENFPTSLQVENAWYAIGQLNYKLGNYEDSRTAFNNILIGFPNSEFKDDAQLLIAQSFLDESNYEQAYPEFDKFATEEFKNYPELHAESMYKAAFCLNQLDRYDEAISRYTNFITQFPEHNLVTAAYFDQGAIYAKQKDYDNARVNYELALQNTADKGLQSEIQSAIGQTYYEQADYENAILAYTKLLDEYPESTFLGDAKLGIADSNFRLESWEEAITSYKTVIEHEQSEIEENEGVELKFTPYCAYQIGEAYYKLGKNQRDSGQLEDSKATLELALEWYQRTVDDFPENPVAPHALYGAIWTLNDLDRKDELEKVAHEFIEKNKNHNDFDILAAEVQLRFADIKRTEFKQYVEAAEEYAKLWDYRPLPKFHLVKLMGKFFEGRSYYEAAKPEGYQAGDPTESFNAEHLQKSVTAYQDAVQMFSDDAFLPGITDGLYSDFPERIAQVEACLMNEALSHEMLGAWDTARERYTMIPESSEYYHQSLLLTANSYVNQGDKDQAITYYNSILPNLASNKNNISLAEIKLADLLRTEKRFEEAAVQYQAVVEGDPTGEYADDAQYLIGLCFYHASADKPEFIETAESAFNQVISVYGDSPNAIEAYYGLALLYQDAALKHGDTSKWALILQIADAANEKFANSNKEEILNRLGRIDLIKASALENTNPDDVDSLVASLQRIIDNTGAPIDARIRSQLKIGHTYYGKKRFQEALAAYKLFVENFPDSDIAPSAQYQTAVCYYQIAKKAEDAESTQLAYTNAASAAEKVAEMTDNIESLVSTGYTLGLAKLGLKDTKGAIEAFMQVTALEGQTEEKARKNLISQAHSRLAELHSNEGNYKDAVKEYQYIIANNEDADLRGRSYFAIAYIQDEHLKVYDDALKNYQGAIELADDVVKAQSLYRMGLIYQDKVNKFDKALEVFQNLIANYSSEQNIGVASMVADASLRRSDLYVKLGRLDEAIAEAVSSLKKLKSNAKATVAQKVAEQYTLGYLYSDKARSLYSGAPGTQLKPYIDKSKLAADAFFEVSKLAAPIESADKQTVISYVQNALFQSGQIYYSVGISLKRRAELLLAIKPLTEFVKYADTGVFPASNDLQENVETALTYLASANFDLGRIQVGLDEEMSAQAIAYFEKAADLFSNLVKRYPNAMDAALWQYQAGEAFYTTDQFDKAIPKYDKVRRVNKSHEKAPESLYAIATCYQFLSEKAKSAGDAAGEKALLDKLFETNEILIKEFKNSRFAGDAFINIGNKYYNTALDKSLEATEQIRLFRLAIDNYKFALASPGLSEKSKNDAESFLDETESYLAHNEYDHASKTLGRAQRSGKKSEIEAVIELFKVIVKKYPDTKYGDLSYVRLGDAYTILANKEEKYYPDALYYFKRLPKKYELREATDIQVKDGINYSITKSIDIEEYMQDQNIQPRQESEGDN